jgi:DNA repair protein RadC
MPAPCSPVHRRFRPPDPAGPTPTGTPTPTARILAGNAENLSPAELLGLLLGPGGPGDDRALNRAARLLAHRTLSHVVALRPADLLLQGVPPRAAATLLAARELARRLAARELAVQPPPLDAPARVVPYLLLQHARADQQVLGALHLDLERRPITTSTVLIGTLHRVPLDPRTVLTEALRLGAASLVVFRLFPSGDPTPTVEDILFKQSMSHACEVIGLDLLDYLVITHDRRWSSLRYT